MDCIIEGNLGGATLAVGHFLLRNIENKKNRNGKLDKLISGLELELKSNPGKFLGMDPLIQYRQFIDSSKSVVTSKDVAPLILMNMVLEKGRLPTISRVVDTMNFVSITSGLTISIWDFQKLKGDIVYKLSQGGEKYWPFMGEEMQLLAGELAAFDDEKVLCLVRYRDSKYAPVELETKDIVVHIQGVKGIDSMHVAAALDQLADLLLQIVGGELQDKKIVTSLL